MRFEQPRRRNEEERILPLANIVFLLLIFFMLAGRLTQLDPFAIEPPQSASEGQAGRHELLVLIGTDGRLALEGETVDPAELGSAVAERLEQMDDGRVRIKADGRVDATRVVAIMELLREAGVERLELLTVAEDG